MFKVGINKLFLHWPLSERFSLHKRLRTKARLLYLFSHLDGPSRCSKVVHKPLGADSYGYQTGMSPVSY